MGRLANKVAIVTGAYGGLGAAEVKLLAEEGAKVIATGRDESQLNRAVAEINAQLCSDSVVGVAHDISIESDWAHVVAAAVSHFGKLDILVNNAALPGRPGADVWDIDAEEATRLLTTNVLGALLGIKTAMPELKKAGSASIVNISSAAAFVAGVSGGSAVYSATKAALGAGSREIALGVAKAGVRLNTIYPGLVRTPILDNFPEERIAGTLAKIPVGFAADPIDIAYGVLYLASDESRFVTGADLVIDGGYTAQ